MPVHCFCRNVMAQNVSNSLAENVVVSQFSEKLKFLTLPYIILRQTSHPKEFATGLNSRRSQIGAAKKCQILQSRKKYPDDFIRGD